MENDSGTSHDLVWHHDPVWSSDFFVRADLSEHGCKDGLFEQFWVRKITDRTFEIRCIPFFTYGIALGDIVETNDEFTILGIAAKSGHRTLRIAISTGVDSLHEVIHGWVLRIGLLHEWHRPEYVAVDCPPELDVSPLISFLIPHQDEGNLHFELDDGSL